LAAAYGYAIAESDPFAKKDPFVDGNRRISLLAIYTFLGLNGIDYVVPEAEAAVMILPSPPPR
jgi:death-on-curing protein